jgi:hypothetical protein
MREKTTDAKSPQIAALEAQTAAKAKPVELSGVKRQLCGVTALANQTTPKIKPAAIPQQKIQSEPKPKPESTPSSPPKK